MVAIIDYGMGNLRSVANAIDLLGFEFCVLNSPEKINKFDRVILPGVGSFGVCAHNLFLLGFDVAIKEYVKIGKPLMGICLGMQILATTGTEGGIFNGLNLIDGEITRFDIENKNLKIPHVGWNEVDFKIENHPLTQGIKPHTSFYFTHSYHFNTWKTENIFAVTQYSYPFTSSVFKDNIFATQFHPEKSQDNGLKLLQNFLNWNP